MYVAVECDRCGKKMWWHDIVPKYVLVLWTRESGWSVGKNVLCVHCRKKVGNRHGCSQ